jgi:hypothetical protein
MKEALVCFEEWIILDSLHMHQRLQRKCDRDETYWMNESLTAYFSEDLFYYLIYSFVAARQAGVCVCLRLFLFVLRERCRGLRIPRIGFPGF